MFKKGDVYIINGDAVRWVGVVIEQDVGYLESGQVRAIEIAYNKVTGGFIGVDAAVYFNADRPGQRVLLQVAPKKA